MKTGQAQKTGSRASRRARAVAGPFLKWAGGKGQLLEQILRYVPGDVRTYYEPFVGGGAVFFALSLGGRFKHAVIADSNAELVNCYQALKDDVEEVIAALKRHRHDEKRYYEVRAQNPDELSPVERAARTIYLNKTGYNGLYRVNSKGIFNVPFGRYMSPWICDEERLRADARCLKKVDIVRADFEEVAKNAGPGDFVYFDPPYVPVSRTADFTAYDRDGFGLAEQERLAAVLDELGRRRIPALLSNADCPETQRLYEWQPKTTVMVRRAINSVASRRGPVPELLVRSFDYRELLT